MLEIARSTPCLHCTFAPRTRVYAALHAAAFSGSLAAARQLLNVGGSAMIFAASNDGKSPLVLAAEQKKASMVKVQLRTNALDRTDVQLHKRALPRARAHTHTHTQYLMEEKKRTDGLSAAPPPLHAVSPLLAARLPQQAPGRGRWEEHDGCTAGVVVGRRAVDDSFRSGKRCLCATASLSL